jgi:DNA (cytosine-5)-methyltransferase 1
VLTASSPGEVHPGMPPVTHSEHGGGGLKKYTTPRSLIEAVRRNAPNHDVQRASRPDVKYQKWNWEKLTSTITCNGGEKSCHPSGTRSLTVRELAALQGFPVEHVFYGAKQRKQVGNAVPPSFGKVLFDWIRRNLEKVDGVVIEID